MPPVTRPVRTRLELSLSSSREHGSRSATRDRKAAPSSSAQGSQRQYSDLDRNNGRAGGRRDGEDTSSARRAPVLPHTFLTHEVSSAAYRKLPRAREVESLAEEESILRKWENWSTRMGEQLALEGTVPAVASGRNTPRNGSFRSVSQFSSRSMSHQQPPGVRGSSPLRRCNADASTRCSSRSRSPHSSVGSEKVVPFKVGERLTESAERRRQRPKSTRASRELLFRRALGLGEQDSASGLGDSFAHSTHQPPPLLGPLDTEIDRHPGISERASAARQSERDAETEASLQRERVEKSEMLDKEWTRQAKELLGSHQRPAALIPSVQDPVCNGKEVVSPSSAAVVERVACVPVLTKWHLPLGDLEHMRCVTDVELALEKTPVPFTGVCRKRSPDGGPLNNSPACENDSSAPLVGHLLDRSAFNIVFVDHHVDDDQMSAYGIEVPPREEHHPHVLPDWDESRRRFAPTPLESSQEFL
ncbi:hypothetical protein NESM_000898800 [Novymonas esmeraldas]|uniref:Uncharacterized protein n=1 Tax=Novymonas esmeraldas TaxID=1808958 RepID=A0AAW0F2I1_9TRYP